MARPKDRPVGKWVALEYRDSRMFENGEHRDPVKIDGIILEMQIIGNVAWLLVLDRFEYE